MDFQEIVYEVEDSILTITLNRPERLNAFTPTMGQEVIDALDRADADDDVRAVIFTRDGGGRISLRLFDCTKPVIAAINGPAVGVGITMTLPMDVRLASDDARMGFVFTRRGIVPEACSSWFLPRIVGISRAMEWAATGRVFDAEEALAGGLLRSVHPAGELL